MRSNCDDPTSNVKNDKIPLFDSLTHPTLTGRWRNSDADAKFSSLSRGLARNGFIGACAIGIAGIERYEHRAFIRACRNHPSLHPVAGFPGNPARGAARELDEIARLGFIGIKIHPRFSKWWPTGAELGRVFSLATERNLSVFLCTYLFGTPSTMPVRDPFFSIIEALQRAPGCRLVLAHGGGTDLVRYAELARTSDRVILDLSFTMMRYRGTSLERDIKFALSHLPDRICVGSDHPEYGLAAVRRRFEELSAHLPAKKRRKVAHENIMKFLGIPFR